MANELIRCKDLVEKYSDFWKSIEIRGVAVLIEGKWVALEMAIKLSAAEEVVPTETCADLDLPWLRIIDTTLNISALSNLFQGLARGLLDVGEVIYLGIPTEDGKGRPLSFWFRKFERAHYQFAKDTPSIVLQATFSANEILAKLPEYSLDNGRFFDDQLKMAKTPFNGRADFIGRFLGETHSPMGATDMGRVTLFGQLPFGFARKCGLNKNNLVLEFQPNKIQDVLSEVNLGVIGYDGAIPLVRAQYLGSNLCHNLANGNSITLPLKAHTQITAADVFMIFREEVIASVKVEDPTVITDNPRVLLYEQYDQDLKVIKEQLSSEDAARFESGVALLMHFCGLNTAGYGLIKGKRGISGIQDEIDIISFVGERSVVAVECTTKDINTSDKISKFSRKIKNVKELLPDYSVLPLIFTGLELDKISAQDLSRAKTEGIGVLAIENIMGLLAFARKAKPEKDVLDHFYGFIPPSKDFPWRP